jgi:hypothetical protein
VLPNCLLLPINPTQPYESLGTIQKSKCIRQPYDLSIPLLLNKDEL